MLFQTRCLRHLDPQYENQDYVCEACQRVTVENLELAGCHEDAQSLQSVLKISTTTANSNAANKELN